MLAHDREPGLQRSQTPRRKTRRAGNEAQERSLLFRTVSAHHLDESLDGRGLGVVPVVVCHALAQQLGGPSLALTAEHAVNLRLGKHAERGGWKYIREAAAERVELTRDAASDGRVNHGGDVIAEVLHRHRNLRSAGHQLEGVITGEGKSQAQILHGCAAHGYGAPLLLGGARSLERIDAFRGCGQL